MSKSGSHVTATARSSLPPCCCPLQGSKDSSACRLSETMNAEFVSMVFVSSFLPALGKHTDRSCPAALHAYLTRWGQQCPPSRPLLRPLLCLHIGTLPEFADGRHLIIHRQRYHESVFHGPLRIRVWLPGWYQSVCVSGCSLWSRFPATFKTYIIRTFPASSWHIPIAVQPYLDHTLELSSSSSTSSTTRPTLGTCYLLLIAQHLHLPYHIFSRGPVPRPAHHHV